MSVTASRSGLLCISQIPDKRRFNGQSESRFAIIPGNFYEAGNLKRQVFELRFAPTHAFFDHRSQLLDVLYWDKQTKKKNFEHWQLNDNRIDVFDADNKRRFFFTFHNCGFSCENAPTENYVKEQLSKFVKLSFGVLGKYIEEVRRIGFRDTRIYPVRDFDALTVLLLKRFVKTDDRIFRELNASFTDLQLFPLIFKQGKNGFQITLGPTKKEQLAGQLWGADPDLPEQSLFVDVDYYAIQPAVGEGVDRYVSEFLNKAHETQQKIFQEMTALAEESDK